MKEILSNTWINFAIRNIAAEIDNHFRILRLYKEPVFVLGIKEAGLTFSTELSSMLTVPHSLRWVCVNYYDPKIDKPKGKAPQIIESNFTELKGARVLIADCVIDSGMTMKTVYKAVMEHGAKCAHSIALIVKPKAHLHAVNFYGYTVPDKFLVGYGLDTHGEKRDLSSIYEKET